MSLLRNSSLDVVYHHYRLDEPAGSLRSAGLEAERTGRERDLGHALDVVLAVEEWVHFEFTAIGSLFRAGEAFGLLRGRLSLRARAVLIEVRPASRNRARAWVRRRVALAPAASARHAGRATYPVAAAGEKAMAREKTLFCTGAGGFVGRHVLAPYLEDERCDVILLEQGRFRERLEAHLEQTLPDPARRERVTVVSGDISRPDLGLDRRTRDEVVQRTTHAIHLAALYNLSAPRDASMRINVEGTRHVLDLLEEMPRLERFGYASTIAVAGRHPGTFTEDDLDVGQTFENHYDATKFLAEKLVRERRASIPTVILRPTTVVGHSKTGVIDKIDGPYYALGMIARNRHLVVPDTRGNRFHFAPVDFVAEAFHRLFEDEASVGRTFHLVDPEPPTYLEFMDLACDAMGRRRPLWKLPAGWMRPLGHLPGFERMTGVPREAFLHSFLALEFDATRAESALARHGVACPPVASYIDVMVDYFVRHADDPRIRKGDWRQTTT